MNPQLPDANPPNAQPGTRTTRQPGLDPIDPIDHILLDDTLIPTSGFAASVMETVAREEARKFVPSPIPFPWKLAVPTLAAIVIAILGMIRFAHQVRATLAAHPNLDRIDLAQLAGTPIATQALPAIAAIAGTLAGLLLTRYLALGRLRG